MIYSCSCTLLCCFNLYCSANRCCIGLCKCLCCKKSSTLSKRLNHPPLVDHRDVAQVIDPHQLERDLDLVEARARALESADGAQRVGGVHASDLMADALAATARQRDQQRELIARHDRGRQDDDHRDELEEQPVLARTDRDGRAGR